MDLDKYTIFKTHDTSMYTVALASRLTGLTPGRVKRWLRGYEYTYIAHAKDAPEIRHSGPVISRRDPEDKYVSFLELIDLLCVKRLLDEGLSLFKIRKAFNEVSKHWRGAEFARRCYYTDGCDIYFNIKGTGPESLFLTLDTGGQFALAPIIEQTAKQIDFDEETRIAIKWYPTEDRNVVLDPQIAFGAPSIAGRNLKTANVYDFYKAENNDLAAVCSWLNIEREKALSAVNFEKYLLAA